MDLLGPAVAEGALRPFAGRHGDERNDLIGDDGLCHVEMAQVGKARGHAHGEPFSSILPLGFSTLSLRSGSSKTAQSQDASQTVSLHSRSRAEIIRRPGFS